MKDFFKNITRREYIFLASGLLIGLIFMALIWPKRIAKLENGEEVAVETEKGNVTADQLYNLMKNRYSSGTLIEIVDRMILLDKYTLTDEDIDKVKENANYYFNMYEQNYGMDKATFLNNNGFDSEEDFVDYLKLDYLRNKYYEEYLKSQVKDSEIEEYYNSNVFAPFNVEHILVKTSSTVDDETAKSKATLILNDINNGMSFADAVTKYSSDIVNESFQITYASQIEQAFLNAAKALKDGEISSSLVKTSYGYHIIYRTTTDVKDSLEEAKPTILDVLSSNLAQESDNSLEKVLVKLREENKMTIRDTEIKSLYNKYIKSLDKNN